MPPAGRAAEASVVQGCQRAGDATLTCSNSVLVVY
jgi:hypothetical protein